MQSFFPTLGFVQFDFLSGAVGVLIAILASFIVITLIASYYRFQKIIQLAETSSPEEMGTTASDILHVQLARYLAACARKGTAFSCALIRTHNPSVSAQMDSPLFAAIKSAARSGDVTCAYDEQTLAILLESDPEDAENILARITKRVVGSCPEMELGAMRVGIASYPGHGLRGKGLLKVALESLDQTDAETPIYLPEIIDVDVDAEDEEEGEDVGRDDSGSDEAEDFDAFDKGASKKSKDRHKDTMLDELTGVLKPSAISAYMQRTMSEWRRKKQDVALFCIGVNNIDQIARFHGEDAADYVLAGVSQVLQDNLRGEDLIGRHEKSAFLVLAVASQAEAEIIGKRISTLVQQAETLSEGKKLRTSVALGVAAYPDHGRNLHQLYQAGQRVLDYNRANDIRAYAIYDPKIHDIMPLKPMKSIKSRRA